MEAQTVPAAVWNNIRRALPAREALVSGIFTGTWSHRLNQLPTWLTCLQPLCRSSWYTWHNTPALNHILRLSGPKAPVRQTLQGLRDHLPGAKGKGQTSLWARLHSLWATCHTWKVPKDWPLHHTKGNWNGIQLQVASLALSPLKLPVSSFFPEEKMKHWIFFLNAFSGTKL